MPGPMRRMARTAAVAGTAAHVAGKHQAEKDAQAAAGARTGSSRTGSSNARAGCSRRDYR